jgi:hypothetical protein
MLKIERLESQVILKSLDAIKQSMVFENTVESLVVI